MNQLSLFDPIEIPLTKGYVALVDPADADLLHRRWRADKPNARHRTCYANYKRTGIVIYMHRVVMERIVGRPLEAHERVDHRNGNGLDNRRSNLRLATTSENNRNVRRNRRNTSGYKGVSFFKETHKWRAQIRVNRKMLHLGLFDTPELAYEAYCQASRKYHGDFGNVE
ncbi:MAG: HNH endonuclease [Bryobacterales bacterium]|nr:HNH endonuclease [Bryobacterales bacterium]